MKREPVRVVGSHKDVLPTTAPWRMLRPDVLTSIVAPSGLADSGLDARLRLRLCQLRRLPVATSRVLLEFDGPGAGQQILCQRDGSACEGGDLRLAALATIDALREATGGELRLELLGVKSVRAFDTSVMMVAVQTAADDGTVRLVGAALVEDDILVAVVRATLHAANRVAAPLLVRRHQLA